MHLSLRWPKIRTIQFLINFGSEYQLSVKTLRWPTSFEFAIMWHDILGWHFEPKQGLFRNWPYKLSLEFTYAIDKSECDINQGEILEDQKISFSNKNCVTKDIKENDPGHIFYSLTLELTNNNIIVTGPEKITIQCKVPNVKNVEVRQGFKANKSISFELNRCWWRMLATGCVSDSFDMLVTFYIF